MAQINLKQRHLETLKNLRASDVDEGFELTPFPPLTGFRASTSTERFASKKINSKVTLGDLQEAAYCEDVSPAAPIQIAWAKILEAYVGKDSAITFLSILPDIHGNCQSRPLPLTFSRFVGLNVGRNANGSNLSSYRETILNERIDDEQSLYDGLTAEIQQIEGSLLDVQTLLRPQPDSVTSEKGQSHVQGPTITVQLKVASSNRGTLSLGATALATHMNADALQLMLEQFDHLLTFIISRSNSFKADLSQHLAPALCSISNPEPTLPESFSSLQSQFESFASSDPQRIALEFALHHSSTSRWSSSVWTYGELNARAEALAAHLQWQLGDLINHVVPICMDRCPELYVAILGILKAGGAWCPIDPSFPPQRRHDLIVRAGAKAIIVNTSAPKDGIPNKTSAIDIGFVENGSEKLSRTSQIAPNNLAYLIWTSGTTGPPKGVPITHQAAVASMRSLQASVPTNVRSGNVRCMQLSQFTFDVFVQDLFYTWGVGGTLISANRATMLGSFAELATDMIATHAHLTPAFGSSVSRQMCPTLEVVTMIGEKLTQNVADNWSRDCRLYNTYGPAEATVVSTLRLIPHRDLKQSINIGYPLPTVFAFVMCDGEPVLKNGVGELALGGPQLAHGYWNDLAKTEERFVWHERLRTTLYMTGDVVRQLHDGSFDFIGRTDDLVKIQGIRIELSEIAFALRGCHPAVQQIEVQFIQRPDRPSEVLVAFLVVPEFAMYSEKVVMNGHAVEVAKGALIAAKSQLPDYMVPKAFLVVGAIPFNSSAKIDRAAIRRLYADIDLRAWEQMLDPNADKEDERNELNEEETLVAEKITELTGTSIDAMSRGSGLPSIGIDSITAIRLATRLHNRGIAISVVDILQSQTLGDLLQFTYNKGNEAKRGIFDINAFHHEHLPLLSEDVVEQAELLMPTLPLQESLISESFQAPQSYWSHSFFSLKPEIDLTRLENAWGQITKRTDALRTAFIPTAELSKQPNIDSTFIQLIYRKPSVDLMRVSSSDTDFEDQVRSCAVNLTGKHQRQRFAKPPWAVTIFIQKSRSIMMFSTHHSIRDEPSLNGIMADLYDAYLGNATESLEQRQQLRDAMSMLYAGPDQSKRDERFWKNQLSGFDEEESFIWPELRHKNRTPVDGTIRHTWCAERSFRDLQDRAASIGASSLVSLLRIIWGYILLQYLEADKIVFGETWSARGESSSLVDVIGPLISVVPVPFKAHGTLRDMLQRDAEFQKISTAHRIVHPLSIRKLLRRSKDEVLYPAIFNFVPDSSQQKESASHELWQQTEDVVGLFVEHAIAFNASITNNGVLELELIANKQHMDFSNLKILAQQLDTLFEIALQNSDVDLNLLANTVPQDQLSIAPAKNDPSTNRAWTQSPTAWIDQHAVLHSEWCAAEVVSFFEEETVVSQRLSYAQLQNAYRNIAALIKRIGCKKQTVGVCLDRCLEVYAVILAVMSTGNTYLPIAEDLPKDRKLFLLQDSDSAIIFTTKSYAADFVEAPPSCRRIFVEDITYSELVDFEEDTSPQPNDGAYLLYTSGSTGSPKGVLVSRGNLMSFIEAISHFICANVDMASLAGMGKWLGMASYAFDVHLLEMFFPWRHGMATVTAPRAMLLDNLEMALQKLRVTHASFVPSLVDNAGLDPANLPDLRYMSVGGEKITKKVIDTWSRSHVILANAYGPTEMTVGCCFKKVEPETNLRNIGYPLSYTTAHILRPDATEYVLRGLSGELCLTGDLVATGYHKRPDAKGFVADFHGQKMYRTGDKVRLMADGSLDFLGRDDDQTKIRGQRVELGEVSETVRSAVTKALPVQKVEVASLITKHASLARPQLASFVAVHDVTSEIIGVNSKNISFDKASAFHEVRAYCASVLPSFMVPEHIIRLTSLPLVPSSRKVDNKSLRAMFNQISISDLMPTIETPAKSSDTLAMNEKEIWVRDIAAEVLAVDKHNIQRETNLFRLGLDSINVISLTIKLQKRGFDGSVSTMLKSPTVEQISRLPYISKNHTTPNQGLLRRRDLGRDFRSKVKNGHNFSNIASVRPCLPLQETLIASSLNHEGEALYVNHVLLELSDDVDHEKLIRAWKSTAEDHEILRTCFHEFEKHFVQLVFKHSLLSYELVSIPYEQTASSFLQQRQREIAEQIVANIECKPPINLTLAEAQSGGQVSMLMVSLHHGLYDEESFSMILDEVYARYRGIKPAILRTPISSLIEYVNSQDLKKAEAYWKNYLTGFKPRLFLPVEISGDQSKTASKGLSPSLAEITAFAASINGTAASVMQTLFGVLLLETFGVNDVVFGTILSGRVVSLEDSHTVLAPCITSIPQRVCSNRNASLKSVVLAAQKGFVESIEYQHTALRDIHCWVKAEKPLFETLFSYTRKRRPVPWSHLWREVESSMPNEFPLTMEIEADMAADKVVSRCDFTAAFGTLERAEVLLERLDQLVLALVRRENMVLEVFDRLCDQEYSLEKSIESKWTKEERLIQGISAEFAGVPAESIERGASFFALGIDSITAIQFARKLRDHHLRCSSADIMRYPCVGELAQHIASIDEVRSVANGFADHSTLSSVSPNTLDGEILTIYPCTPLQSSMLTNTLGHDGSFYVHYHAVRLNAHIATSKVRQAWEHLAGETEILRTSFHFDEKNGAWSGVVHKRMQMKWTEHGYNASVELVMEQIKSRMIFREESDFARPPWTIDVVGDTYVLSLHHCLYDGETLDLLFQDLSTFLNSGHVSRRTPFNHAARAIHENEAEAVRYWTRSLEGFEGVPFFSPTNAFREVSRTLEIDHTTALQGCRNLGVTLQTLSLFAFAKMLTSLSGHRDIVFGHIVRGRALATLDGNDVLGPMFNTVPVRVHLERTVTNQDALKHIQTFTGLSQAHQHAPLSQIQQQWRHRAGNMEAELFDSLFVFQKRANGEEDPLWARVAVKDDTTPTEYPLNFAFEQRQSEFVVCLNSTRIENLDALVRNFERVFNDSLQHPERSAVAYLDEIHPIDPKGHETSYSYSSRPKIISPSRSAGAILVIVKKVLAKVSGIPEADIANEASIFSLGLDSISAIKIATTSRKEGLSVSVADILQGRTVLGICQRVGQKADENPVRQDSQGYESNVPNRLCSHSSQPLKSSKSEAIAFCGLPEDDIEDVLPCSPGQWYHLATWHKSGRTLREATFTYVSKDRLNLRRLLSAWRGLRHHHPILRSLFAATGSTEAVQIVLKPAALRRDCFQVIDSLRMGETSIGHSVKQQACRRFDLYSPPSELVVLRGEERDYTVFRLHHSCFDAWTIPMLRHDLMLFYEGKAIGESLNDSSLLRNLTNASKKEDSKSYWRESLKDCQSTMLRSANKGQNGTSSSFFFVKNAITDLNQLESRCHNADISLPTMILVAFARALARRTSLSDPIFGFFQAGRSFLADEANKTSFPCLNMTPLMTRNVLSQAVLSVAQAVQTDLAARVPFEQTYLYDIFHWLGHGHQPLFNTFVNIIWDSGAPGKEQSSKDLLSPLTGMEAENILPSTKILGRTAVDALDTSILADENLFLDVQRCSGENELRLVVRCDDGGMSRGEAEDFVSEVVEEIKICVGVCADRVI